MNLRPHYRFITLIKKWPKGVDRWQYMDNYIEKMNHVDIKDYTNYTIKQITRDYSGYISNL